MCRRPVAVETDKQVKSDCSIIYVRLQREKREDCVKSHLKTDSGCRGVDIHPDAAAILRNFISDRKSGFLLQSANRTVFDPRNIARDSVEDILQEMGRGEAGTLFNGFPARP